MAGIEMPMDAVRRQIAGALDLIVHVERASDGRRRVSEVVEIGEYDGCDIALSSVEVVPNG